MNSNADALSRNPLPCNLDSSETISEGEIQVSAVRGKNIFTLVSDHQDSNIKATSFATEQKKDPHLAQLMFLLATISGNKW